MRNHLYKHLGVVGLGSIALLTIVTIGAPAGAATATPGAPPPPSLTFAGPSRATVFWARPARAGASPVTGYVVRPYLGSVARPATVFHSTATTGTVGGLVNGKKYTFTVAAVNAAGTGPASRPSPPVTVGTPSPPRAVTASPGDRRATVKWVAPASANGAPITGYVVTPYLGGRAQPGHAFRSTRSAQTITGLRAGGRYRFTVRAVNSRGTGKAWVPSKGITVGPIGNSACPSARPPSTYAGVTLTVDQTLQYAYDAGFRAVSQLRAVVGIGRAESGLTTRTRRWHPEFGCRSASDVIGVPGPNAAWNATHTQQMHSDRGLWQISSHFWPQYTDAQVDDPRSAARVVWAISRHGADFSPWNTWPSPAQSLEPSAATVNAFLARQ